ncbi:putative ATPase, AAA-type, core, AAA-type ATPase domain-containing protein [Rosa chinensis]|uniref:Putative ATPase, AAA-type, core, AAA-type ATPase domain-containing protein n=1 Tax=Rosa chinensis TaxID=74649 RepID=A0A2P6Q791_ROSCH|nr:putative ATPase, AAA-type, core, AAA-type ATPase domain-containing protein [Rosa chinensis]
MENTSTLVEHMHSVESSQKRSYINSVKKTPTSSTSKGSSACASRVASLLLVLFRAMQYLIQPIMRLLHPITHAFSKSRSSADELMIMQIEEYHGMSTHNKVFEASELYLHNKMSPSTRLLKIVQTQKETKFAIHFSNNQEFEDIYEGVQLKWKYNSISKKSKYYPSKAGKKQQFFELRFDVKHKEKVMDAYLPYVVETFKAMKDAGKIVKLHTLVRSEDYKVRWSAINLEHPATFETIAMDSEQKRSVLEDLDRFVKRKEFYQRVGRAWKRGYLLYGPPGTGKSSLIGAIANYLKFDIYDLQLTHLMSDMELRRVLLATTNKSILVIEDIDCSQLKLQDRKNSNKKNDSESNQLSLLGRLLNFTDGLWYSCGEERIIIFTTSHKSKLDPALLRSGRMDMHVHMSYCSYEGFKTLASNYLGIKEHQPLFDEIESLLQKTEVSPAQVTEELMKSEIADVALQALITGIKEMNKREEDEKKAKDEERVKNDKEKVDHKQLTYFI